MILWLGARGGKTVKTKSGAIRLTSQQVSSMGNVDYNDLSDNDIKKATELKNQRLLQDMNKNLNLDKGSQWKGSEKQIEWAKKIKSNIIGELDTEITKKQTQLNNFKKDSPSVTNRKVIQFENLLTEMEMTKRILESNNDARVWIDNRPENFKKSPSALKMRIIKSIVDKTV